MSVTGIIKKHESVIIYIYIYIYIYKVKKIIKNGI